MLFHKLENQLPTAELKSEMDCPTFSKAGFRLLFHKLENHVPTLSLKLINEFDKSRILLNKLSN